MSPNTNTSRTTSSATRPLGFKLADFIFSTTNYVNLINMIVCSIIYNLVWIKEYTPRATRPFAIWFGFYVALLPCLHGYLRLVHRDYYYVPLSSIRRHASRNPAGELVHQMIFALNIADQAFPPSISKLTGHRLVTPALMTLIVYELQEWSFRSWKAQATEAAEVSTEKRSGGMGAVDTGLSEKAVNRDDESATKVTPLKRLEKLVSLNILFGVILCYLDLPFLLLGRPRWLDYDPLRWNFFALALPSFVLPIVVARYLKRYHPSATLKIHPLAQLPSPQFIRIFSLANLAFVCCMPEVLALEAKTASATLVNVTFSGALLCIVLSTWEQSIYHGWEVAREDALDEERRRQAGGESEEQQIEQKEKNEDVEGSKLDQGGSAQTVELRMLRFYLLRFA
ncbi:hypothetical protein BCR35DRAFT_331343 [Leucosporidium creatinivorum]|uniref:Uncharacterized protein n=1 Tax=Leucosporidium creatinivorum TaxID=106004 RepID=A0A1Y2FHX1_9BASI|nr:hypothetical protein BCR35DRAFT_331343 [Leucosporidium creatinivorum]